MPVVIHLESNEVPAILRGSYTGKKFKAHIVTEFTMPITAGLWQDGSCDTFHAIDVATGRSVALPGQAGAPWDKSRTHENRYAMQAGIVIVEHSIFCGKDMGLTFYVHPDNATKMLPAPSAELAPLQKLVLDASVTKKSSYAGRDRYQMTCEDLRWNPDATVPTRAQWDAAKDELIAAGLLDKRGAVTVKGRNAHKR